MLYSVPRANPSPPPFDRREPVWVDARCGDNRPGYEIFEEVEACAIPRRFERRETADAGAPKP